MIFRYFQKSRHRGNGALTIFVLILAALAIYIVSSLAYWATSQNRLAREKEARETSFQIAEAGLDYYRWHLAHDQNDYWDGNPQGTPGPFVHDYFDKNGNLIGAFSLDILAPPIGSTLVTVTSTGSSLAFPGVERTVRARYAIPSLARYAVVADANMRFGSGTEIFGPVHSNGGIRFDGLIHNLITSNQSQYDDPDHAGGNEFGVHTHVAPADPLPPAAVPTRTDIFEAGRQFPAPPVDFDGFTADMAAIQSLGDPAQGGVTLTDSGFLGWHVVLRTDDTMDTYRVTQIVAPPGGCSSSQTQWGTWSIQTEVFDQNIPFPANGIIFVEDHLWLSGQIQTAKLTIASAVLPEDPLTNTNITINNDLRYTTYDGQDTLGIIAQYNVNVGLRSEDDLVVDGALIAKNGRVGRHYYNSSCGVEYIRQQITLTGMIATKQRYGFAYTDGTGYQIRNLNYDANLLYGPPPSFPLTSDQFEILSWEEILP